MKKTMPYFERDFLLDYKLDFKPDFMPDLMPDFKPYFRLDLCQTVSETSRYTLLET